MEGSYVELVLICSHGWRWVDRSTWTEEEEVENIKKAISGTFRPCDVKLDGLIG